MFLYNSSPLRSHSSCTDAKSTPGLLPAVSCPELPIHGDIINRNMSWVSTIRLPKWLAASKRAPCWKGLGCVCVLSYFHAEVPMTPFPFLCNPFHICSSTVPIIIFWDQLLPSNLALTSFHSSFRQKPSILHDNQEAWAAPALTSNPAKREGR